MNPIQRRKIVPDSSASEAAPAEAAKRTYKRMLALAHDEHKSALRAKYAATNEGDKKRAEVALAAAQRKVDHHRECQEATGIKNLLALAQTDPRLIAKLDEFDQDTEILNVANGTINLRTGELRSHRREDMLMLMSPVEYDAGLDTTHWEQHLLAAMGNDMEMAVYLQEVAGYSATGNTDLELFFMMSGVPGTGKGTFVRAVGDSMGDYACTTTMDIFLHSRNGDRAKFAPEFARFVNKRLIVASESRVGDRLDPATISTITGNDRIPACHKFRPPFDFLPRFKPWLQFNKRPATNPSKQQSGLWRRVQSIPFDVKLADSERKGLVKAFWSDPKSGGKVVLTWIVAGAARVLAAGAINAPRRVRESNEGYRSENDHFARFATEWLVPDPTGFILRAQLNFRYQCWCAAEGIDHRLTAESLYDRLREALPTMTEAYRTGPAAVVDAQGRARTDANGEPASETRRGRAFVGVREVQDHDVHRAVLAEIVATYHTLSPTHVAIAGLIEGTLATTEAFLPAWNRMIPSLEAGSQSIARDVVTALSGTVASRPEQRPHAPGPSWEGIAAARAR